MSKSREDLHSILTNVLYEVGIKDIPKERHLFYRKPAKGLHYPCIMYDLSNDRPIYADNKKYIGSKRYEIIVVDEDPDSLLNEKVSELPYSSLSRTYETQGLNHFVYDLYF